METTFPGANQPALSRHDFFKLVGASVGAVMLTRCLGACASQAEGDLAPMSNQKVDFTLRLDDKANENLLMKGGYVIINEVIVAQTKAGNYIAVSANCTHQGTQLTYKPADNHFYCPLHLSRFDPTGKVITGPATVALAQFTVDRDEAAGTLRIHN